MRNFVRNLIQLFYGWFWGFVFKIDTNLNESFEDIIGYKEQKLDLAEVIQLIKSRKNSKERIPKGIIIDGPKGTGKTLLAKAFIAETKLPCIIVSGSEINSPKDVKHLFGSARVKKSCIIFIDEFDVLGQKLKNDVNEKIIAQLNFEMDKKDHILVIATSRDVGRIEYSLKRQGRFERIITMFLPNFDERKEIIEFCSQNKEIESSKTLNKMVKRTVECSTLEIIEIMNNAIKMSNQKYHNKITIYDFAYAQIKHEQGNQSEIIRSENDLRLTAYHEVGHAVCALLANNKRIREISIIPHKDSLGYVSRYPIDEWGKTTKQDLENEILVSLAGRAAEEVFCNLPTSGARGDIKKATNFVKKYLSEFCFDEKMGITPVANVGIQQLTGTDLNNRLLNRAEEILNDFYQKAKEYLIQNKDLVEEIVKKLLDKKFLEEDEVYNIYNKYRSK